MDGPTPRSSFDAGVQSSASASIEPAISDDEIVDAMAFRKSFFLRSDEAWVREVFADPRASSAYGVPLLPDEEAALVTRLSTPTGAKEAIVQYAQEQPDYAGVRKDYERGGMLIVSFAGQIDKHRADLERLLPPGTAFDVVQVKYAEAELTALKERIVHDSDWMKSIEASLQSVGVDPIRNLVRLEISSANPDAAVAIAQHYNAADRIYVVSDGIGAALRPLGTLIVHAVDGAGRPVFGPILVLEGDVPGSGIGDVGLGTDANGRWQGELISMGYTVKLNRDGKDIAKGHVIVRAHQTTTITLLVP